MKLGLGIDAGGTYTDVVLMNLSDGGAVLESNKALTTYPDPIEGIENAIDGLNEHYLSKVRLVCVSTTLATNSILEGKGYPSGLILIGYSIPKKNLPTKYVVSVSGGHDAKGDESAPLDLDMVEEFVDSVKNKVFAFAVSSYFSVRCPQHELTVKELIGRLTALPVVCGHELSQDLGAYERAVTAVLNSQLIPITKCFMDSVTHVMETKGIDAKIMMLNGDGSLVDIQEAIQKPVETVFSGPAASLIGASHLTKRQTCIAVDVGGTSTDVSSIHDGIPEITEAGAAVGRWKTRVKAIKMETSPLGGDSHIWVKRRMMLGPKRVIPLCLAACDYPELMTKLKDGERYPPYLLDEGIQPTKFFIKKGESTELSGFERQVVGKMGDEPLSIMEISERLDTSPLVVSSSLDSLIQKRCVQAIGFTPTDALHVLGTYQKWCSDASIAGAERLAEFVNMDAFEFSHCVKRAVARNIALNIMSFIMEDVRKTDINKILERNSFAKFKVEPPVVLIGAPVKAYVDELGKLIDAEIIIPHHYDVGNAVGALCGKIVKRIEILIRLSSRWGTESKYVMFSPMERKEFFSYEEALNYSISVGKEVLLQHMESHGLDEYNIELDIKKNEIVVPGLSSNSPIEAKISIIGVGRPW